MLLLYWPVSPSRSTASIGFPWLIWFAMAHRRYIEATAGPDGWMAIAFLFLSCEVAPDADTSDQQGITKIGSIFEFIAALPPWMASRTTATS
jgi:hypothetical protein